MSLTATWLGSASFKLEDSDGHVVYLDPWLDAPPGNPGCPVKVADVTRADLVIVTHGDPAHYGRGDAPKIAAGARCRLATNEALSRFIAAQGLLPQAQLVPLALNREYDLGFINLLNFPVVHPPYEPGSTSSIPREPNTGFSLQMGGVSALYTGDTILGDAVYAEVARKRPARVGLLPLGSPLAGHGTMDETVDIAVSIARTVGCTHVIPHYRFVPNNPAVGKLAEALKKHEIQLVAMSAPGQTFEAKA